MIYEDSHAFFLFFFTLPASPMGVNNAEPSEGMCKVLSLHLSFSCTQTQRERRAIRVYTCLASPSPPFPFLSLSPHIYLFFAFMRDVPRWHSGWALICAQQIKGSSSLNKGTDYSKFKFHQFTTHPDVDGKLWIHFIIHITIQEFHRWKELQIQYTTIEKTSKRQHWMEFFTSAKLKNGYAE